MAAAGVARESLLRGIEASDTFNCMQAKIIREMVVVTAAKSQLHRMLIGKLGLKRRGGFAIPTRPAMALVSFRRSAPSSGKRGSGRPQRVKAMN